jgi:hypothetical protein
MTWTKQAMWTHYFLLPDASDDYDEGAVPQLPPPAPATALLGLSSGGGGRGARARARHVSGGGGISAASVGARRGSSLALRAAVAAGSLQRAGEGDDGAGP